MTTTDTSATEPRAVLPHEQLWDLAQAVVPSQALHVVAELGVADALGDEPASATELAHRCGVDADRLGRVLRLLSAHGIFQYDGSSFAHNEASLLLKTDHPGSMRAFARLNSLPAVREALGALETAVRGGSSGADVVFPAGFFAHLADHPGEAAVFGQAMAAKARADIADVLDAYDFSRFHTIADIGGGHGHLLAAILQTVPEADGVLFDLPEVAQQVQPQSPRLRVQGGDFFRDPLPAADAYLLMEVLHDWSDDDAQAILRAVRSAARPGATVLVLEHIAPDEGVDRVSATLDVLMLAVTGGRERSAREFGRMFDKCGLSASGVTPTRGHLTIVEAAV